jgi:hypothetical protein
MRSFHLTFEHEPAAEGCMRYIFTHPVPQFLVPLNVKLWTQTIASSIFRNPSIHGFTVSAAKKKFRLYKLYSAIEINRLCFFSSYLVLKAIITQQDSKMIDIPLHGINGLGLYSAT